MRGSSCSVISGIGLRLVRFTRIATTGSGIPGGISSREYMDKLPKKLFRLCAAPWKGISFTYLSLCENFGWKTYRGFPYRAQLRGIYIIWYMPGLVVKPKAPDVNIGDKK